MQQIVLLLDADRQWWANPNHDLIWVQKIWFRNMRFDLDLILFYNIWVDDLNESQRFVIWAKNNDYFVGVFTAVELNC